MKTGWCQNNKLNQFVRVVAEKSAVLVTSFCMITAAMANPEGGVVESGNVTITQTPGNTQINQTTDQAIINWHSFNIGVTEKTQFVQPGSNSIALNRIDPNQGASQIFGQLSANGKIILVNQAGIFFGPTARVDVGGIIASTTDITSQNFLAGKLIFDQHSANYSGAVINQGTIIASNYGLVALVGNGVRNDGTIQANLGSVVLASGNKFTVDLSGDQLINFTIDEEASSAGVDQNGQKLKDGVSNTGSIIADGGKVIMSARAAQGVLDNVVNMSGVVQAKSVSQRNGEIILGGDENGTVTVSGKLIASGGAGLHGGKIKVLSKHVRVKAPAVMDASGDSGGGEILVGGNAHGAGPEPNAADTIVERGATLNADALTNGDGGKIVAWSDNYTLFYGNISARGGSNSGNGGFVETSSHNYLDVLNAKVNLMAANGQTGTWLLDPSDLTICTSCTTTAGLSGNTYSAGASNSNLLVTDLTTSLASANIIVQTSSSGSGGNGDILVNTDISWSSGNKLTLSAYRNITSTANISNTGGASVVLQADNTGTGSGTVSFSGGKNVTLSGGSGTVTVYYNPATFGTADTIYTGGTSPTAYQLINSLGAASDTTTRSLASLSNSSSFWSGNFALATSIDATATSGWNSGAGFSPIGSSGTAFTGKFDGQNDTISNLFISRSSTDTQGFFGHASGATIGNLTLSSVNITGKQTTGALVGITDTSPSFITNITTSGTVTGTSFVGGILGTDDNGGGATHGTITNVTSSASVNGTGTSIAGLVGNTNNIDISNSSFTGSVSRVGSAGTDGSAGGLVGESGGGSISQSFNTGSVSNNMTASTNVHGTGGLMGRNSGTDTTISNSYNTGSVTGGDNTAGIEGAAFFATATLTNVYNSGAVSSSTSSAGGLVATGNSTSITNSYWDTSSSGQSTSDIGGAASTTGGLSTAAMKTLSSFSGWSITSTASSSSTAPGNTWFIFANTTRPLLMVEYSTTINNAHQLQLASSTTGANYTLGSNLNLAATSTAAEVWAGSGALTFSGNSLSGSNTIALGSTALTMNNAGTSSLSGVISGTGSLTMSGSGILNLSAANTYTGSTSITAGTLRAGIANAVNSSSNVSISSGATFDLNNFNDSVGAISGAGNITLGSGTLSTSLSSPATFSGSISGSGGITKLGNAALTLSGSNNYTGTTTITAGSLTMGAANAMSSSSAVSLANTLGATLNLNGFSQAIGNLSGGGSSGGNVNMGAGTLTVNESSGTTYSGTISGSGGLTKSGTATLNLGHSNAYTGTTTINNGILQVGAAGAINSSSAVSISSGGTLDLNNTGLTIATLAGAGNVTLGSATLSTSGNGSTSFSGIISGTGGLGKSGSGTLNLSGANTYTGTTTVSGGTLQLGASGVIADTSTLSLSNTAGVIFDLNGFSETVGALSGGGATGGNISLGSGTLTAGTGSNTTYAGVMSGTGGFTKQGTGTLGLTNANTYSGTTSITGGTLRLNAGGSLNTATRVSVTNNGVFSINNGGSQTIAGLTGTSGSTIALQGNTLTLTKSGTDTFSGTINGPGTFNLGGSGTFILGGG